MAKCVLLPIITAKEIKASINDDWFWDLVWDTIKSYLADFVGAALSEYDDLADLATLMENTLLLLMQSVNVKDLACYVISYQLATYNDSLKSEKQRVTTIINSYKGIQSFAKKDDDTYGPLSKILHKLIKDAHDNLCDSYQEAIVNNPEQYIEYFKRSFNLIKSAKELLDYPNKAGLLKSLINQTNASAAPTGATSSDRKNKEKINTDYASVIDQALKDQQNNLFESINFIDNLIRIQEYMITILNASVGMDTKVLSKHTDYLREVYNDAKNTSILNWDIKGNFIEGASYVNDVVKKITLSTLIPGGNYYTSMLGLRQQNVLTYEVIYFLYDIITSFNTSSDERQNSKDIEKAIEELLKDKNFLNIIGQPFHEDYKEYPGHYTYNNYNSLIYTKEPKDSSGKNIITGEFNKTFASGKLSGLKRKYERIEAEHIISAIADIQRKDYINSMMIVVLTVKAIMEGPMDKYTENTNISSETKSDIDQLTVKEFLGDSILDVPIYLVKSTTLLLGMFSEKTVEAYISYYTIYANVLDDLIDAVSTLYPYRSERVEALLDNLRALGMYGAVDNILNGTYFSLTEALGGIEALSTIKALMSGMAGLAGLANIFSDCTESIKYKDLKTKENMSRVISESKAYVKKIDEEAKAVSLGIITKSCGFDLDPSDVKGKLDDLVAKEMEAEDNNETKELLASMANSSTEA